MQHKVYTEHIVHLAYDTNHDTAATPALSFAAPLPPAPAVRTGVSVLVTTRQQRRDTALGSGSRAIMWRA